MFKTRFFRLDLKKKRKQETKSYEIVKCFFFSEINKIPLDEKKKPRQKNYVQEVKRIK